MQFIIVADNSLAPLARKIAHALSSQKTYSGAFWSVEHYKDNEAQLDGKQPVIFLGDHELTKSYVNILPKRFSAYGTYCYHEGSKAVLVAETPSDVSTEDLNELKAALDQQKDMLLRLSTTGLVVIDAKSFLLSLVPGFDLVMWVVGKYRARKRRQEYGKLQYDYLLVRFLVDEFRAYASGIEER